MNLAATDYNLKKHYDFKKINIVKHYEKDIPSVSCEGGKIQQVLLNLFRNGAQIMHESATEKPEFIVSTFFDKKKNVICITISDNGPGMTEEIRKRVFEPFFTTKSEGMGTGLGLSVSYFIITENHGGEMTVESQPGEGSRFIMKLPRNK